MFRELSNIISWISEQILPVDSKITFDRICERVNKDERFKEFPQDAVIDALESSRQRVIGVLSSASDRIRARGFH